MSCPAWYCNKEKNWFKISDSLNRFGHSISYDEVNNIETFFAEMQANEQSHQSFVPNNIQPSTFITFVYDNCDHNPETISGISLYCTNGIIIQAPGLPTETSSSEIMCEASTRPRKRSFKALTSNDKPVYKQPKKLNSKNVFYVETDTDLIHQVNFKKEDLIWILARYKSSEFLSVTQTVPGWTGFYHLVLRKNAASPTNKVFYLPSIDKSPTKVSTVYEVLLQVKAKTEALRNTKADLVLEHAIYCKALLMEPKNMQLKNFINLRMGGFHASYIFIAVIGKRFGTAGLKDFCIEATLIGISSVKSMIKGKQYNRGVKALKMVYEALQQLKIEALRDG